MDLSEAIIIRAFEFDHIGVVTVDCNLGSTRSSWDAGRVLWYNLKRDRQFISERNPGN